MKSKLRPRTFFDIDIGKSPAGRIVFELYDDLCPRTAENFIKLCTGDAGIGESTGKKLHYLNSAFHRVIKGFMIQGGDFSNGDGSGGESVFGGRFADENLTTPHDRPFLLSMANCGPNTNGSQFFITTKPASHLDGKHVVFGHVVSGENLIESIENLPVNSNNRPVVEATISNCGELIPIRKKKAKKLKEKEASADSSSSKGKKKKKSKKKKHRNKKKTKPMPEEEAEEMYQKCSVRPDEIPEVPKPYFLYRGNLKEQDKNEMKNANDDRKDVDDIESSKYVAKEMIGRSGRLIKGRGQLRYYSKSPRDRLDTPPHWKKESHLEKINDKNNEHNRKVKETDERMKYRKSRSPSPNYKDRQNYRRSQRENVSPIPVSKNREQNEVISREKRKKYEVWKDIHSDDKIKRVKKQEEVKNYCDLDIADRSSDTPNLKETVRKRSSSVENVKRTNRDKVNVTSDQKAAKPQQQMLSKIESNKPDEYESGTIIFPYADESDDSLKHKRSEKVMEKVQPVVEQNPKMIADETVQRKNETKKSGRNDNHDNSRKNDSYRTSRKRSLSSESKSPVDAKKRTHSPPAHLVAKWQNRREKIMIRRPSVSRSNDRHHSKPHYSPRRRSSKYSSSSKSDLIIKETKSHNNDLKSSEKNRKIPVRERSSSGTIDSSLSSAGSSVSNRPCRIDSELSDTEKTVNTQCWVNDNNTSNQQPNANKETKIEMTTNEKPKEANEINKMSDNSTDKETLMVLKGPEKPWVASQWKTEEEEANKRIAKIPTNSVLAKLREDDQKTKSVEKPAKTPAKDSEKKVQSPISQSISKYRSPSGSKSSGNRAASSKYSSSSSSASVSRGRSRSRYRSYSRSKVRSKTRSRSRSYRRKYRGSHYHRSNRRSNSRSGRRYRSRSRSYSPSPRRRYSSKSSSSSRSSRYRSRRSYRGLGFRRPSGSPRPRK